jgi:hypothetical protein
LKPIDADIRLGKFVLKGKCSESKPSVVVVASPTPPQSTKLTSSAYEHASSLLLALFAGLFAN